MMGSIGLCHLFTHHGAVGFHHPISQWTGMKHVKNIILSSNDNHNYVVKSLFLTKRYRSGIRNEGNQVTTTQRALANGVDTKTTSNEKYQQLMSASTLSLAPMMECTDRHFRQLVRLISQQTLLYTEMTSANAISYERMDARENVSRGEPILSNLHTNSVLIEQSQLDVDQFDYDMTYLRRFIGQAQGSHLEGPSVLQLGGSDPHILSEASSTIMDLTSRDYCDYTALNLNCGCPSQKVASKGFFGAALMEEPKLVKKLVTAMNEGCSGALPITLKCRIGTDTGYDFTKTAYDKISDAEELQKLRNFIEIVASSGVVTDFQIHARIAVLNKNFSPADNRNVPKLKYDMVRKLVEDYPSLTFSLNGGINTLWDVKDQLEKCPGLKGVMVGRAWAAAPWNFSKADDILYTKDNDLPIMSSLQTKPRNRLEVLKEYGKYADYQESIWDPLKVRRFIVKAVLPLFSGEVNSKRYRILLDEIAGRPKKLVAQGKTLLGEPPLSVLIINAALETLSEEVLLSTPDEHYEKLLWEKEATKRSSKSFS